MKENREYASLIASLSNANGVSGFEDEVLRVLEKESEGLGKRHRDSLLNYYIEDERDSSLPLVQLDCHSDEVGFMVRAIRPDGMLEFMAIGGWVVTNIPAHMVRVQTASGKYIPGVVASKPPHYMSDAEKKTPLDISQLVIDIGATSAEEVRDVYRVRIAAPVVPDVTAFWDEEHDRIFGKAFDNRMGCAEVISVLSELKGEKLNVRLTGAFASQEEVGTRGAKVTAQEVLPDLAIVFEGSPADDFYFRAGIAQCSLKAGTQIRHMDSSYVSSPAFMKYAHEIGKKYGIKYQDAVRRGGGTDAGVISLTGKAVPTLVLGIPSRYVHTHYNFCAAEDIEATVSMAAEVIKNLDEERINALLHKGEI